MEQAVNVREAPQRHHAERDGDQRHDGAAEDVRQPRHVVGVELQGEIGHEEHLGGDRAGGGGHQRGEQAIPQRRFVIARQVCEKISAAATGVPNIAPMVPAAARMIQSMRGTFGSRRAPAAATSAILMAVIGFSGPRLTPPAGRRSAPTPAPAGRRAAAACRSAIPSPGPARRGPAYSAR